VRLPETVLAIRIRSLIQVGFVQHLAVHSDYGPCLVLLHPADVELAGPFRIGERRDRLTPGEPRVLYNIRFEPAVFNIALVKQ
jgi:hypothetical protein